MTLVLRCCSRLLLVVILFMTASLAAFARPVALETARHVAWAQYVAMRHISDDRAMVASTALTLVEEGRAAVDAADSLTVYYAFDMPGGSGFVIVAGDDAVDPVLAYSSERAFPRGRPSPEFLWWMRQYREQIVAAVRAHVAASEHTALLWRQLTSKSPAAEAPASANAAAVGPLVQTAWDQAPYYNDDCPVDGGGRAVTGCVATAFAQIMKYHASPGRGMGDHGYNHPRYGYLYANFASAAYNWNSMPNDVLSNNPAVAQLMFHVGVACEMNYGADGSGAYPKDMAEALVRYFGYQNTTRDVERKDYSDADWINLIRAELDKSRPVEYHGFGDGSGHSFVCDGYNGNYFHINWGWSGSYNGYFLLSNLVPDGVGAGGGAGNYNDEQGAVIGIIPAQPVAGDASLVMNSDLNVTPNPVSANNDITITFDLVNRGTKDFAGDYCVALFDDNSNFIKYAGGILSNWSLKAGYHYTNGVTLHDTLFGVYPGNYSLAVYARPTGKEWTLVGNGSFSNAASLEVTSADYGNDMQMYADATLSPEEVHPNEAFTVHTDFANNADGTFTGDIGAWLYTLDGDLVGEVGQLQNLSLGGHKHWVNGQTFSSNGLAIQPGQYLLAFFSRETGGDWVLVNPETYVNPVNVEFLPATLAADRYEPNNSSAEAYALALPFSGNTASANTAGSNIHASGNNDYYRVALPGGYDYDLVGVLHDSWTDEGGGFTNDVSVMWNSGGGWSEVFDDSTDVAHVAGGRTVTFKVQSLYLGTVGTYRLDIRATRRVSGVPGDRTPPALTVYPNPATNEMFVDPAAVHGTLRRLSLVDAAGRTVLDRATEAAGADLVRLDVSGIPSGAYTLVVESSTGTVSSGVVVRR